MLVAVQLFMPGLYLPPVLTAEKLSSRPPQTTISVPVHTAVWSVRAVGAPELFVNVQVSVAGSYLPPEFRKELLLSPPQMIISAPVQTAVWESRASGGAAVAAQVLVMHEAASDIFGRT